MKFIAFDTETGGIDHKCSLLTAFFQVYDETYTPKESLSLKMRPNEDIYVVSAGGLMVNGINLVEHHKSALRYKEASKVLYDFLEQVTEGGKTRLYAIGLGLEYDIDVITRYLLSKETLSKYLSVKKLDVMNIAVLLKMLGMLPNDLSHALTSLAAHYKIDWPKPAHDAEGDTLVSAKVLFRMVEELGRAISGIPTIVEDENA